MRTDDILQVEQLYYFYEQGLATGRYMDLPLLFSRAEDTSFLVLRVGVPVVGWENIVQYFHEGHKGAPRYDTYHTGAMICTPLIEVAEDGQTARGMFPTQGHFLYSQDSNRPNPPFPVDTTFEMWFDDFVKENEVWKIKRFHFISMTANPIWSWNAACDDGYAARCDFARLGQAPFDLAPYRGA